MKAYSLLLLVLLNSCLYSKIAVKTGIEDIQFGYGGGFTGEIITYKLSADGKLFQNNLELKKITPKETNSIFHLAKDVASVKLFEPDNMYSFIEIKTNASTNRLVWTYGSSEIDTKIIELNNKLISITK